MGKYVVEVFPCHPSKLGAIDKEQFRGPQRVGATVYYVGAFRSFFPFLFYFQVLCHLQMSLKGWGDMCLEFIRQRNAIDKWQEELMTLS